MTIMKNTTQILILLSFLLFSVNISAQGGWSSLSTTYTGNFKDIHFINATTGYAVGGNNLNGTVYKTTNGGTTWTATTITGTSLESVWFVSTSVGYAAGSNGKVYKTTNSGSSWSLLTTGSSAGLKSVCFPSSTTGYAVGGTTILMSTNSGTSWSTSSTPQFPPVTGPNLVANGVYFTSSSNGAMYGSYNFFQGWINLTSNGGTTWGVPYTTAAAINDIDFPSSSIAYAVGNAGGIYKTLNSGSNWTMQTSGVTGNINGVYFISSTEGFAVGDSGLVLKTVNGGTTWVRQTTNVLNHLQAVSAPTTTVAFVSGDNNKILKTTTGGVSLIVNVPSDSVYCNGYTNLHAYTTYDGNGTLTYTWNSSPFLSSTTDSIVTAGPLTQDESFIITVTDGNVTHTDTVLIKVIPLPTDSICIVAIDSLTNHPIVVFEKHISGPIDYYKIYRESNVAGIYDSIGFLPADSAGVYMDTNANVQVRQYAYKISNVDSCGNESDLSTPHKTMHLQINAGAGSTWNLIWTPYEGVFVQSYEIWRGVDTINMVNIGTVPGSNSSYTDLTPPTGGLYYVVRIVSAYVCHPYNFKGKTSYNSSRSNRANNGMVNTPVSTDFSATPLSGTKPLNVQFTDGSMGSPNSWKWYFGDGNTSTQENPQHTYNADGKYTVKLVSKSNTSEDSITKIDFITVGNVGFEDIDIEQHLKIYPNPISNNSILTIDYDQVQIENIDLMNIVGKKMAVEIEHSSGRINIGISNLSSGIYILKLSSKAGDTLMRKIIIR